MDKPVYQKIVEFLGLLLLGGVPFGNFLSSINAFTLINLSIALGTTIVLFISNLVLAILIKKRKIRWVNKDGVALTISQLGRKLTIPIVGALLVLWVPVIINLLKSNSKPSIVVLDNKPKPIFDSTDKRFKILVLPFQSECEYLGAKYDIGNVICRRLEKLNQDDTLNLVTHFFTDSLDLANFTSEMADSIMLNNNASQIIYGYYSFKECENDNKDKICYNYRTNKSKFYIYGAIQDDTTYRMKPIIGMSDIRNGSGQQGIDNIVYMFGGLTAYFNNKHESAIRIFEKISNLSEYWTLEYLYISCQFDFKNYKLVETVCLNRLKTDSSNNYFWNLLGLTYYRTGMYSKAKECYVKSLAMNSNSDFIWANLGIYYLHQSDSINAKKCFDKAIKLNPKNENAWFALGNYYLGKKNHIKAKEHFENAININSKYADATANLALTYLKLKDTTNSLICYNETIEIDSNDWGAWNTAGFLYLNLNQLTLAKKYLEKSFEIAPNEIPVLLYLAKLNMKLLDYNKAVEYYQKASQINIHNGIPINELGICYFIMKDTINAIKMFNKVIKDYSDQPKIVASGFYNLGLIYISFDQPKAVFYFQKAISLDSLYKQNLKRAIINNRWPFKKRINDIIK